MDAKGLVDSLPTPDPNQVAGGGFIIFGLWLISQVWKGYKEFRREKLAKAKDEDEFERSRRNRLTEGFTGLDKSRNEEIDRLNGRIDQDNKRFLEEVNRLHRLLEDARRRSAALEENRNEGWDKGRYMEDMARHYRHAYVNMLQQLWAYGRVNAGMPPDLKAIYDMGAANQPLPQEIKAPTIPELQFAPRKPPPINPNDGG